MKTVAELINDLFRTHRRADGREYTHKDVSVALGGLVEPSHLSKLRTGKITNPSRETLLALCNFFQVPSSYFFPELPSLPAPQATGAEAQKDLVRLALRSAGLRPEVEAKLEELINALGQQD
jgi:transcriptional regulator with XRE-family HTH domain